MIQLKKVEAFAHGNHREVYRHPEKKNRCLKRMTGHWKHSARWKRASVWGRIVHPHGYYNENEGEYQFSKATIGKLGEENASKILAIAHGYVESDRGEVLEVDLITDHDGSVSLTLKEYLWEFGLTPACELALEEFWRKLDEYWVFVQARPDNLVIRRNEGGDCELFAIDGYQYGQFIPLGKWFRREKKRKLAKLRRKQVRKIETILSLRESGDKEALGRQGIQI